MNFFKNIYKKIKRFWKRDKRAHLSLSGISVNFDWYGLLIIAGLIFIITIMSSFNTFKDIKNLISESSLNKENVRVKTLNVEDIKSIIESRGSVKESKSDSEAVDESVDETIDESVADEESLPADEGQ